MLNNLGVSYDVNQIINATGGKISGNNPNPSTISGVTIDSRKVNINDLYVALKGERVDGHSFVANAIKAGASYCLVEKITPDAPENVQILVNDCLKALQDLAKYKRDNSNFKVIGVTGSVGKTSTKEMLALAFGEQLHTHATIGNYNNHIGLPLTIANTPKNTEILILEMGMNHAGEINILSEIARPNIAIITTVEAVHLEFFTTVADIARAKAEIMDGLPEGEVVILPIDNPYFEILRDKASQKKLQIKTFGKSASADYRLIECKTNQFGTEAIIHINNQIKTLALKVVGEHLVINSLAVLAAIEASGLNVEQAIQSLFKFSDAKGRGELLKLNINNNVGEISISILDETYNASPASMRASFKKLHSMAMNRRKIAVLGDMRELGIAGAELHADLVTDLLECEIDQIYLVGELMQHLHEKALKHNIITNHFINNSSLAKALKEDIRNNDFILCKGSRGSKIEEIIDLIKA
jgi:UDP-N-acetylmuramoyl-tripeptide--D-alanyl-D-alanine ligase